MEMEITERDKAPATGSCHSLCQDVKKVRESHAIVGEWNSKWAQISRREHRGRLEEQGADPCGWSEGGSKWDRRVEEEQDEGPMIK